MVEVVEHLDPDALAVAGPALLGGLRPKIAIVTTPNIEYNPVRLPSFCSHLAAGSLKSCYVVTQGTAASRFSAPCCDECRSRHGC